MTPAEAQALIKEGAGIDAGVQAHEEAAATGNLDDKGNIVVPIDDTEARAAEWMIIPKTLAWAITAAMPETEPAYTDDKCMQLARAFVPVADKYGWNGPGDSPELTLLMCGAMFCAPGFLAYKARQQAAEARKKAAKVAGGQQEPAPEGKAKGEPALAPINGAAG